ncbi:hypothetical protein FACS1894208_08190 [Clostridia bacterium]|nr:hypothetical protein FACS1894208_08190 [Clostridia bacterium]
MAREIREIPIGKLELAPYQRPESTERVKRIVANFDIDRLGIITVNNRDKRYYIVDGAHRVSALKRLGHKTVTCSVIRVSYAEEAHLFATQNENKANLNSIDLFNARIEAGDAVAKDVRRIVYDHGYAIGRAGGSNGPRSAAKIIQSVEALGKIYTKTSPFILGETLEFLKVCFPEDVQAKRGTFLIGAATFTALLYAHKKFNLKAIAPKFTDVTATQLLSIAHARSASAHGAESTLVDVFVEKYNYRRAKGSSGYLNV